MLTKIMKPQLCCNCGKELWETKEFAQAVEDIENKRIQIKLQYTEYFG